MRSQASNRLLRAVSALGVQLSGPRGKVVAGDSLAHRLAGAVAAARELRRRLRPGQAALLTGPSGAGKSLTLRALARAIRRGGGRVVMLDARASLPGRTVAEAARGALDGWLGTLARAGLAEAGALPRMPAELSEGQRHRLGLALAMKRAQRHRGCWLLVDEFASTLDRLTAAGLAASVRRWVTGDGRVRVVVATAHDDVLEPLGPQVVVVAGLDGTMRIVSEGA